MSESKTTELNTTAKENDSPIKEQVAAIRFLSEAFAKSMESFPLQMLPEKFFEFLDKILPAIDMQKGNLLQFLEDSLPDIFIEKILVHPRTLDRQEKILYLANILKRQMTREKLQIELLLNRLKNPFIGKITTYLYLTADRSSEYDQAMNSRAISNLTNRLTTLITSYCNITVSAKKINLKKFTSYAMPTDAEMAVRGMEQLSLAGLKLAILNLETALLSKNPAVAFKEFCKAVHLSEESTPKEAGESVENFFRIKNIPRNECTVPFAHRVHRDPVIFLKKEVEKALKQNKEQMPSPIAAQHMSSANLAVYPTTESKNVPIEAQKEKLAEEKNKAQEQSDLMFIMQGYVTKLENLGNPQEKNIENLPQEFLHFLAKTLPILLEDHNAFLDFLKKTLPKVFAEKVLKKNSDMAFLTKKLQQAIRKKQSRPLTQLKEAFIQEITQKMNDQSGYDKEISQDFIRTIEERLRSLIEKSILKISTNALQTVNFFLGMSLPTSPNLPFDSTANDHPPEEFANLTPDEVLSDVKSESSSSPESAAAPQTKRLLQNNLGKAINALTGIICRQKNITDKEEIQIIREELEKNCQSVLGDSVKITTTEDLHKSFENILKEINRKRKPPHDKEDIEKIKQSLENLCLLINIHEKSTPEAVAKEIECLSAAGGEFEYSGLLTRQYSNGISGSGNILNLLRMLPRHLEVAIKTTSERASSTFHLQSDKNFLSSYAQPLLQPTTLLIAELESKESPNAITSEEQTLTNVSNLGKAINALTGEIFQQKKITDLHEIQKIRDMLTVQCAKHNATEEITQENLLGGFTSLVKAINNSSSDKEGVAKRKNAFGNFCVVLRIDRNSTTEAAADKIKTFLDKGGEFEYSILQTLEMCIFDGSPKKLEAFLRGGLAEAFVEKTAVEMKIWREEKMMRTAAPQNIPSKNTTPGASTPTDVSNESNKDQSFNLFLDLFEQVGESNNGSLGEAVKNGR